jgi:hypothetical protein
MELCQDPGKPFPLTVVHGEKQDRTWLAPTIQSVRLKRPEIQAIPTAAEQAKNFPQRPEGKISFQGGGSGDAEGGELFSRQTIAREEPESDRAGQRK